MTNEYDIIFITQLFSYLIYKIKKNQILNNLFQEFFFFWEILYHVDKIGCKIVIIIFRFDFLNKILFLKIIKIYHFLF